MFHRYTHRLFFLFIMFYRRWQDIALELFKSITYWIYRGSRPLFYFSNVGDLCELLVHISLDTCIMSVIILRMFRVMPIYHCNLWVGATYMARLRLYLLISNMHEYKYIFETLEFEKKQHFMTVYYVCCASVKE